MFKEIQERDVVTLLPVKYWKVIEEKLQHFEGHGWCSNCGWTLWINEKCGFCNRSLWNKVKG